MKNNIYKSGSGTSHAIMKKGASIWMILLSVWFIKTALTLSISDIKEAHKMLISPINITLVIMFIIAILASTILDFKEMLQDYISCANKRFMIMISLFIILLFLLILGFVSLTYLHNMVRISSLL